MFDSHIHSNNSVDGKQTLDQICETAISLGLCGVAITDHANTHTYISSGIYPRIVSLISDVAAAREKYGDKLNILLGIELGEYLFCPEYADTLLALAEFDFILGAIHHVDYPDGTTRAYAHMEFDKMTDGEIEEYLGLYFDQAYKNIDRSDMDSFAHLTCPLRYVNGKYRMGFDISRLENKIEKILRRLIERGISLEVNTHGLIAEDGEMHTIPDYDILARYKALGGEKITLGSDSHVSKTIARNFSSAVEKLKELGFDGYYYYEKRKPHKIAF